MIKNTSCPVCAAEILAVTDEKVLCVRCGFYVPGPSRGFAKQSWDMLHKFFARLSQAKPISIGPAKILVEALKTYGRDSQLRMCQEECMELALAIQKMYRDETSEEESTENLYSELADVLITTRQVTMMLDQNMLQKAVDAKMGRLEKRINEKIINDFENGKQEI